MPSAASPSRPPGCTPVAVVQLILVGVISGLTLTAARSRATPCWSCWSASRPGVPLLFFAAAAARLPADRDRSHPVPHPGAAVHLRRRVPRRGDVDDALGRFRAGLGRSDRAGDRPGARRARASDAPPAPSSERGLGFDRTRKDSGCAPPPDVGTAPASGIRVALLAVGRPCSRGSARPRSPCRRPPPLATRDAARRRCSAHRHAVPLDRQRRPSSEPPQLDGREGGRRRHQRGGRGQRQAGGRWSATIPATPRRRPPRRRSPTWSKKGADVIIGPSSSVLAQRLLTAADAAQVPMISPVGDLSAAQRRSTPADVFFRTCRRPPSRASPSGTLLPSKKQLKVALVGRERSDRAVDRVRRSPTPWRAHGGELVANIALTASSDARRLSSPR